MAALHAEAPGEAAAPADADHLRARAVEQGGVGVEPQHGMVVAVGLDDDAGAGQVGGLPAPERGQVLGQRPDPPRDLGGPRDVEQLDGVAAQGGEAGRLETHDGDARGDVRVERSTARPTMRAAASS